MHFIKHKLLPQNTETTVFSISQNGFNSHSKEEFKRLLSSNSISNITALKEESIPRTGFSIFVKNSKALLSKNTFYL